MDDEAVVILRCRLCSDWYGHEFPLVGAPRARRLARPTLSWLSSAGKALEALAIETARLILSEG